MANRFVIAVFVAAAVVYGTTSSFAQSSTTPSADQSSTTSSPTRTFNVCVGGFWFPLKENKCQPHDIYVFCLTPENPPYKSAVTTACQKAGKSGNFTAQTLQSVAGNRCGWSNIRITCQ